MKRKKKLKTKKCYAIVTVTLAKCAGSMYLLKAKNPKIGIQVQIR